MDSTSLVESAKKDPEAFGLLFDRHYKTVYKFFWYRCGNQSTAEDLTSETFYKALRELQRFEGEDEDFLPWLHTIARNTWIDRLRKKTEEPTEIQDYMLGMENPYEQMESHLDLVRLIAQLPESQQEIVRLRFVEDLTVKEVATTIGKSESATKSILYRALKQLKAYTEEFNVEGGYSL